MAGVVPPSPDCAADPTPSSFTLNDNGNTSSDSAANTEHCTSVFAGSYTVTEGTEPAGFSLESLTCEATAGSSGSQDATNPFQANITVIPLGTVTCVYVDKEQLGAIKITKTSSKAAATPLAGATFSITSGGTPIPGSPFTTGGDGTVCVGGLHFGDYVVTETAAPAGYKIDDNSSHTVTVNTDSSCPDTNIPDTQKLSFTDTPLTDLTLHVASEATGGSQSSISCVGPAPATTDIGNSPEPDIGIGDPETVTANELLPGTYTCTVVIDP